MTGASSNGSGAAGGAWLPAGRPALYAFLRSYVERHAARLEDSGIALPDEPMATDPDAPDAQATASDEHGFASELDDGDAQRAITAHLLAIATREDEQAGRALYRLAADGYAYLLDDALEELEALRLRTAPAVLRWARAVILAAPDREAVRFGIALLAGVGDAADCDVLALLGLHEAFASEAASAILRLCPEPRRLLADMAGRTSLWARVSLVEQLAEAGEVDEPDVKVWLLRDAIDDPLADYLALPCASAGGLATALAAPAVDEALLDGAGRILNILIVPGGGATLDDYEDAPEAVAGYLRHVAAGQPRLRAAPAVRAVVDYLERSPAGWSKAQLASDAALGRRVLADARWPALVSAGLVADDTAVWQDAYHAARALNIDPSASTLRRLRTEPFDAARWSYALEDADDAQTQAVVRLALDTLPYRQALADRSGASDARLEATRAALTYVWQALKTRPGLGRPLLRAGLGAANEWLRWHAVDTIAAWGEAGLTQDVLAAVQAAYATEHDPEVRARIETLLGSGA